MEQMSLGIDEPEIPVAMEIDWIQENWKVPQI
jgi:hypothetical protein